MKEKVILAYSGGLDTTAIIPWLKENFDYEVICVCIDCGQEEELDGLEERAIDVYKRQTEYRPQKRLPYPGQKRPHKSKPPQHRHLSLIHI